MSMTLLTVAWWVLMMSSRIATQNEMRWLEYPSPSWASDASAAATNGFRAAQWRKSLAFAQSAEARGGIGRNAQ